MAESVGEGDTMEIDEGMERLKGYHMRLSLAVMLLAVATARGAAPAESREWFVAAGGAGTGTRDAPFGRIQDALLTAHGGDVITITAGHYAEALRTVRAGDDGRPIVLRALGERGSAIVTAKGRVLTINHPRVTIEGLVLDGQYGADDTVRVGPAAHFVTLRNIEVRRSSRDLIDIGAVNGLLIENSLLHHALNAADGRTDAHAVVAGAVHHLTIRDTDIHTFSGDGVQLDPGRAAPGWGEVTLERCRIWLAPLPAGENGFAAGTVPGENAVDTKASPLYPRATLTIRDVTATGFRRGLITNMAAFNLKEHIDASLDGITVSDSDTAFRLRGPTTTATGGAWVTIQNAVVHHTATAFRYEDDIEALRIWNTTLGRNVAAAFRAAASNAGGLDVRNLLVLGPLPREATDRSNLPVPADAFVNVEADDYALDERSPAIDAGVTLPGVMHDRRKTPRPQGRAFDVGAHERPQP